MLKVRVTTTDHETYPITSQMIDSTDGASVGQEVQHRDMNQVITFYNGWCMAFSAANMREVALSARVSCYHSENRVYDVPVNMDYTIAQKEGA